MCMSLEVHGSHSADLSANFRRVVADSLSRSLDLSQTQLLTICPQNVTHSLAFSDVCFIIYIHEFVFIGRIIIPT